MRHGPGGAFGLADAEIVRLGAGEPVVRDGALGAGATAAARAAALELRAAGGLRAAGVGRTALAEAAVRSDAIAWVDPEAPPLGLAPAVAVLLAVGESLRTRAFLGVRRVELQLAAYEPGHGYARHRDAFAGPESRRATAIVYLNPHWRIGDGGQLQCWSGDAMRTIAPRGGRLVVFLSDRVEHSVAEVRRGIRLALTAWYRA